MAIILRTTKGTALTHSELDANFTTLDSNSKHLNRLAGDSDIDFGAHKILYSNNYAVLADLPSASSYHGMFAHVHGEAKAYYAHAGAWVKLADYADVSAASGNDSAATLALIDAAYVKGIADTAYVRSVQTVVPNIDSIGAIGNVNISGLTNGHILKYDSATSKFIAAADQSGGGGGGLALTDLSASTAAAAGTGTLTYNNATGVFTMAPPVLPDVSSFITASSTAALTNKTGNVSMFTNDASYLTSFTETNNLSTAVTWANIPNANVPAGAVTQHQASLAITESQISDLDKYTNADVDTHLNQSGPTTGYVLSWSGSDYAWVDNGSGSGIASLVADTSPQLGGDLDVNSKTIKHTFTMGASGSSHYTFSDGGNVWFPSTENDPILYLRRGEQYVFTNSSGGAHPFQIRTSNGGAAYNTGVTNNGASNGNIIFKVPMSAPATLYYQCTSHSGMGNTINIV